MSGLEYAVALAIAIGVVGVIVPLLPGSLLVLGAILVWAWDIGSPTGWTVLAVATLVIALGSVVKYVVPGRRLKDNGIPNSTLFLGGALGVVGFFVIPVVGLLIGFVLGVYLAELRRRPGLRTCHLARAEGRRPVDADRVHRVPIAAAVWAVAVYFLGVPVLTIVCIVAAVLITVWWLYFVVNGPRPN